MDDKNDRYDHIYVASGTGTTAAGILSASKVGTIVHAISALKGDFLVEDIRKMMWSILSDDETVDEFMLRLDLNTESLFNLIRSFFDQTGVPLEPIYTGKALMALITDVESGAVRSSDRILFVHSGGLQGGKSFVSELPFLAD